MPRIKIDDISKELLENNWQVVSEEYKNLNTQMHFKCPEGHSVYTSWARMRSKIECPVCKQNIYKKNIEIVKPKSKNKKRFLGLDQATHLTGYSIFDQNELVTYGVFESDGDDEGKRFHKIRNWLTSIIESYQPDIIGIQGIQYQQNMGITTFQTLARLQGVLIDLCVQKNVKYVFCHTNTWRAHCGVKGKTRSDKKKSMQLLVKQWYDITVSDDIADAIGIGRYISDVYRDQNLMFWE